MASKSNITAATNVWTDLVAEDSSLASTNVVLQNQKRVDVRVFVGGGSAPSSTTSGIILSPMQTITVNDANIWVIGQYRHKPGFNIAVLVQS